ncbi:MAG: hypothetical protein AVDCRST_MAG43-384 [uncultured Thermomicrobiales bacterium]|uniref:Uncharacterized protein n=1 Tax=uncultured Thermomicrobiales bacterium TaxID=1645740 RepID=A0A6J4UBD0_9BACT|nr:MAG: hypothetical protein AVDCRST_MAG43-384 [uncultured Thermomicrobiales bacterium]
MRFIAGGMHEIHTFSTVITVEVKPTTPRVHHECPQERSRPSASV